MAATRKTPLARFVAGAGLMLVATAVVWNFAVGPNPGQPPAAATSVAASAPAPVLESTGEHSAIWSVAAGRSDVGRSLRKMASFLSHTQSVLLNVELAAPMPAPAPPSEQVALEQQRRVATALRLAEGSPLEALRWATAQPPEFAGPAILAAASEAAREHPAEALNALVSLPSSPERTDGLVRAAAQWAALDAARATGWAAGLPAGDLRERACTAIAIAMADHDPRAAADFVATQIADGLSLRTAAVSVAQRWAQQDPAAAREWADQFPAGPTREDALREIAVQQTAALR